MTATAQSVAVSRTFRATKKAAFDAWTNPASLAQWFGPPGFRAEILTHDLRVGGDWRFLMTDDKGQGFHHFGTFIAIEPADRLAFTWASEEQVEGWRDEAGNPTLVTVTFEENADRVTVVITHDREDPKKHQWCDDRVFQIRKQARSDSPQHREGRDPGDEWQLGPDDREHVPCSDRK